MHFCTKAFLLFVDGCLAFTYCLRNWFSVIVALLVEQEIVLKMEFVIAFDKALERSRRKLKKKERKKCLVRVFLAPPSFLSSPLTLSCLETFVLPFLTRLSAEEPLGRRELPGFYRLILQNGIVGTSCSAHLLRETV